MPPSLAIVREGRALLHTSSLAPVYLGSTVRNGDGDEYVVVGAEAPRHPGSTGRVLVSHDGSEASAHDYYPGVFGLTWSAA